MSTCGYHSPRFSEDIAFLPQWLQPHRTPAGVDEHHKDSAGVSSSSCQNCAFIRDPAQEQQSCLNAMANAASCSGFRLHLSGDEGTPTGATPSNGNVVPFSLHLSSESTAQLSSTQANDKHQILNSATCKGLLDGLCIDGQAQEIKRALQNQSQAKDLRQNCEMASKEINKSCDSKGHRRKQLSRGKVDVRKLRNADVNDAVELSIAASEAMVIAEMILLDSQSDKLATAALEAALHVKEARKQCFLEELEHSCESKSDLDETDGLSELDETEMLDAFQDVGLSLVQTACTSQGQSISGLKQKISQASSHPCDAEVHILEICSSEEQNIRCNSHDADANDYVSDSLARSHSKEGVIVGVQTNVGRRKYVKGLFNKETSFISESMDGMDEFPSASRIASMEMAVSSRASFLYKTEGFCEENQGAEAAQSCSQVVCSSLSLVDPLCSIVPCSISCNEGPPSQAPECKQSKGEDEELISPKESPLNQDLEGEAGPSCTPVSNILFRRRKYSSLRPFSTIAPKSYVSGSSETHNDVHVANCQQERFTAVTLNKIRRVQASKLFVENNVEAGNLQKFSEVLKKPSYAQGVSDIEHQNTKQSLKRKKAQFSGAKISTRKTKNIRRAQAKSRFCWSDSRLIDPIEPREYIDNKEAIFHGLDFLLTGFRSHKEKEIESLIRKFGGYVLSKVPLCPLNKRSKLAELARRKPPIVLSPKKVSTAKFLYGCATNSWVLNPSWLLDSIQAGVLLPPGKYFIRQVHGLKSNSMFDQSLHLKNNTLLFDGVGFLILGKISFCSKFSNIIKHGGGQVFVSLQGLVQRLKVRSSSHGIILVANEASASRHLSYCGLEHDIKTAPASWVIGSLYSGKLIPLKKDRCASFRRIKMPSFQNQQAYDMSQEI